MKYSVIKTKFSNGNIELIIGRIDGKEIKGWDELQKLKNIHIGKGKEAIEVYPKQKDLINYANKRHLFFIKGLETPNTKTGNYSTPK